MNVKQYIPIHLVQFKIPQNQVPEHLLSRFAVNWPKKFVYADRHKNTSGQTFEIPDKILKAFDCNLCSGKYYRNYTNNNFHLSQMKSEQVANVYSKLFGYVNATIIVIVFFHYKS